MHRLATISTMRLLFRATSCGTAFHSVEKALNQDAAPITQAAQVKDWFFPETELVVERFMGSDSIFTISNAPDSSDKLCVEAFQNNGIAYFFLSVAEPAGKEASAYLVDPVNGIFFRENNRNWFLHGGNEKDIRRMVSGNAFSRKDINAIIALSPDSFPSPEYKLTFLPNGKVYYSEITCEWTTASESFWEMKPQRVRKDSFSKLKGELKNEFISGSPIVVGITRFEDCIFWMGNQFAPSDHRFYPAKEYDFGEVD